MNNRYLILLRQFIEAKYRISSFAEYNSPDSNPQLILRHDIDFDCDSAYRIAILEKDLGIKATFFFMLSNYFYNVLYEKNRRKIEEIKDMGHEVTLHFDPMVYDDPAQGFRKEKKIFEEVFEVPVNIFSVHRPSTFLEYDSPFEGVEHTYQNKYFKDIKYISDSTGEWRYGHPVDSESFKKGETIHLLIHPIWWMNGDGNAIQRLNRFLNLRLDEGQEVTSANCKTYKYEK